MMGWFLVSLKLPWVWLAWLGPKILRWVGFPKMVSRLTLVASWSADKNFRDDCFQWTHKVVEIVVIVSSV